MQYKSIQIRLIIGHTLIDVEGLQKSLMRDVSLWNRFSNFTVNKFHFLRWLIQARIKICLKRKVKNSKSQSNAKPDLQRNKSMFTYDLSRQRWIYREVAQRNSNGFPVFWLIKDSVILTTLALSPLILVTTWKASRDCGVLVFRFERLPVCAGW